MQNIQEFFVSTFNNPIIATLFISILPVFELRGAIPFAMSTALWGSRALNMGTAFLVSFIGSSLIVPVFALLFKPILKWLKNTKLFKKFAIKFESRIIEKSKSFENKNNRIKKILGIISFVGIPLPLTGAYTGTALSVILGLSYTDTLLSVITGNLIAGVLIAILSSLSDNAANIVLIGFGLVLIMMAIITVVKYIIKKLKRNNENV